VFLAFEWLDWRLEPLHTAHNHATRSMPCSSNGKDNFRHVALSLAEQAYFDSQPIVVGGVRRHQLVERWNSAFTPLVQHSMSPTRHLSHEHDTRNHDGKAQEGAQERNYKHDYSRDVF
jgi:hypothetical protein